MFKTFRDLMNLVRNNEVIACQALSGTNHIFTKRFNIFHNEEKTLINGVHEVKLISCAKVSKNHYKVTKSAAKKLGGAAALGTVTGPFGAVVGALAFGNNEHKKIKEEHLLLTFLVNDIPHIVAIKYFYHIEDKLHKILRGDR